MFRRCPALPRGLPRSTIGAEGLNFRVRNGTGCFPFAMAAGNSMELYPLSRSELACLRTLHKSSSQGTGRVPGATQWTRTPDFGCSNFALRTRINWSMISKTRVPAGVHEVLVVSKPRPVSRGQLSTSRCLHFRPINPVVWLGALPTRGGGRPHLEACFPLRCFQRLSLPDVANQPCSWRNNWHTRGPSVPVLSY